MRGGIATKIRSPADTTTIETDTGTQIANTIGQAVTMIGHGHPATPMVEVVTMIGTGEVVIMIGTGEVVIMIGAVEAAMWTEREPGPSNVGRRPPPETAGGRHGRNMDELGPESHKCPKFQRSDVA
jgi:hypothetical protein